MATLTDNGDGTASIDLDAAGVFTDADGTIASYSVQSSNTGVATASISGTTLTVSAQSDGTATITVTATDNDGATVDDTFDVTVSTSTKPSVNISTFDKTNLSATYEAIYDKATAVIPFAEGSGTIVEDLVSGAQGTIVDGPSDGAGPTWGTDSEGVHLEWPGDQVASGRYVDFEGTALANLTYDDFTIVAVVAPANSTPSDDGYIFETNDSAVAGGDLNLGVTDDTGEVGKARIYVKDKDGLTGSDTRVYSTPTVNDGTVQVITGRRDGSTLGVDVDNAGFATQATPSTDSFTSDTGPYLGDFPGDTEQYAGKMYALYLFNGTVLTAQEVADINADPYGLLRG